MNKPVCKQEANYIEDYYESRYVRQWRCNRQGQLHHSPNYWKRMAARSRRQFIKRETAMLVAEYHSQQITEMNVKQAEKRAVYEEMAEIWDAALVADDIANDYLDCTDIAEEWFEMYGDAPNILPHEMETVYDDYTAWFDF